MSRREAFDAAQLALLGEAVQRAGVHSGVMHSSAGEVHDVTSKTRVGGLPCMVSKVWRT